MILKGMRSGTHVPSTSLMPAEGTVMLYSNSHFSSAFCLSLTLFILFRIVWWPSVGKELSSWLSACAVYFMPS